jgi:hypothetical protein
MSETIRFNGLELRFLHSKDDTEGSGVSTARCNRDCPGGGLQPGRAAAPTSTSSWQAPLADLSPGCTTTAG